MAHKINGGKTWRATWIDENGKRHGQSGFTTKVAAQEFEDEERLMARKVKAGHIARHDLRHVEHAQAPISEHLHEYHKWKISSAGEETKHVRTTIAIIEKYTKSQSWKRISDIEPIGLRSELGKLRAGTHNIHLSAIAGFVKWMVEHGRLPINPIASLKRRNTDKDKTFTRVPITPEMVELVFQQALGEISLRNYHLYNLLWVTGLRINEALSLTPGHFDFERNYVVVFGKSQKSEVQLLPCGKWLSRFGLWVNSFGVDELLWKFDRAEALYHFRLVLGMVKIPLKKGLDLHSFRHGFCTEMAKQVVPGGITIKDLQILCRHSDITTTAKYLHGTCDGNRGKAVDAAFC